LYYLCRKFLLTQNHPKRFT